MYSVQTYYFAKILVETPILTVAPMLYCVIVYFGIGFTITAWQFFYFYLITMLITQCSASFGYFFSSVFNKEETAVSLAPVLIMPIILFSGFFSNVGTYPDWVMWIQYLSPIRYGLEAFTINEFGYRTY
jgi:ABC-type multidrug transport system permease subunit